MWNSSRRAVWNVVSGIARQTCALHDAGQTSSSSSSASILVQRLKSSLPDDISSAARQARFATKWKSESAMRAGAETTHQQDDTEQVRQEHAQQQDVVSSFMFPWEKRQMQGGALSTWEKYYWGVFVMAIAVFLFSKAGNWMSKDPAKDDEERRRNEEIERQKHEKARRVLIGGSMLEDEEDPFDGLSPEEIEAFVQQATGANAKDPFEGMSPEEINDYLAKNPIQ